MAEVGDTLDRGQTVKQHLNKDVRKGANFVKEKAKIVANMASKIIGDALSGENDKDPGQATVTQNAGSKYPIVARKNWATMGGTPVGKEMCVSSVKKGGGKFDSCGGNVFKGLEGGKKRKSKRRKTRRKTRKSKRKRRRKSTRKRRKTKRKKRKRKSRRRRRTRKRRRRGGMTIDFYVGNKGRGKNNGFFLYKAHDAGFINHRSKVPWAEPQMCAGTYSEMTSDAREWRKCGSDDHWVVVNEEAMKKDLDNRKGPFSDSFSSSIAQKEAAAFAEWMETKV
tara:strand:- start:5839 stop:6678 length:840 start_codon:yes stop_codon:yes gene_type:complete